MKRKMEEAIKFEVEDKDGNAVTAELVLDSTKETAELQMKGGKKVLAVEWEELQNVLKRALDMWNIKSEE